MFLIGKGTPDRPVAHWMSIGLNAAETSAPNAGGPRYPCVEKPLALLQSSSTSPRSPTFLFLPNRISSLLCLCITFQDSAFYFNLMLFTPFSTHHIHNPIPGMAIRTHSLLLDLFTSQTHSLQQPGSKGQSLP